MKGKEKDSSNIFPQWLKDRSDFAQFLGPIPHWRRAAQKKQDQRTEEDLAHLAEWVRSVEHFDNLDMKPMEIAEAVQYKKVDENYTLSRPGEKSGFYYLLSGRVACTDTGELKASNGRRGSVVLEKDTGETHVQSGVMVEPGETFGSLAKYSTAHMLVTTQHTPTEIILIQKDVYRQHKRWQNISYMKNNPLLAKWSRLRVEALVDCLEPRAFPRGATIYEQGDDGDGMYFIKSGAVGIQKRLHVVRRNVWPKPDGQWEVCEKHLDKYIDLSQKSSLAGEFFGESACLREDNKRNGTVRAISFVQVSVVLWIHMQHTPH
jgi:CRP-like cAMP-binding protein